MKYVLILSPLVNITFSASRDPLLIVKSEPTTPPSLTHPPTEIELANFYSSSKTSLPTG